MRMLYLQFCAWIYVPTTTTLAGECFNSLIFHGNIKCITANGYTIIYVGADYIMSHDNHSFCTKNFWEVLNHS